MKWLTERRDLDRFFERVRKADERVLITDYDGTLAPFVFERDRAKPYPGLQEQLQELAASEGTRLIIVTGRTVENQREMMKLEGPVEVWGTHGWERLDVEGNYKVWPVEEKHAEGLEQVKTWAASEGMEERLEIKPASVALHWRKTTAAERERIEKMAYEVMPRIAEEADLDVHEFDGGLELRTPGRDKGLAVRTILEELEGEVAVAYLGDDTTDEDAFREMEKHANGAAMLRILVRTELRDTEADLWLRPPRELQSFLRRWADAAK